VSKFGSDDGSNSNGPKRDQVTVDGFRLDSSQSSWLMDRLGALDEEDQMSMANAAPANVAHQVQMSDHDPNQNARRSHPQSPSGHPQQSHPQQGQAEQRQVQQTPVRPQQHQDVHSRGFERPHQQTPSVQAHRSNEPEVPQHPFPVEGQDVSDPESEGALLLRQKIENLEQQLAEISDLTGDQRARYIQELSEPVGQEGMGREGISAVDHSGEGAFERDETSGLHDETYAPHHQAVEQTYYEQTDPYHEGHRDVHHSHEAYSSEQYQQGQAYYDEAHLTDQQGGQAHRPQSAHMHQSQAQQDYNELPQFLAPVEQNKKSRSAFVGVIGGVVALLIAGGAAYTHFDHGVSDVVKSDILRSGKEPLKLSESQDVSSEATDTKLANIGTDLSITKKFAVQSLQGSAGQNVPLRVQLPSDERLASAFLVVRNLPDWAKLNVGRQMNGLWMVSASQVEDLKVLIPDDQPGQFSFEVDLVVNAGDAPVTKKVQADIAPFQAPKPKIVEKAPEPETKQEVASIDPKSDDAELIEQPEVGVKQGPLIIDKALEEKWLERGTRLLRAGDVSAARLAFSHLAEQGSGRAALAMGMTYDPNQPSSRVVAGIKVDVERAKFWYKRALSLGHEGARDPLRQLERQ